MTFLLQKSAICKRVPWDNNRVRYNAPELIAIFGKTALADSAFPEWLTFSSLWGIATGQHTPFLSYRPVYPQSTSPQESGSLVLLHWKEPSCVSPNAGVLPRRNVQVLLHAFWRLIADTEDFQKFENS